MMERLENWALHAYLDGELDAEETAAIERRLAGDPNARTLLDRMRQQGEALHRAYDGVLDEPVPPDLLAAVKRQAGSGNLPYLAMAASLALLLLGGAGGWLAAGQVSRSVVPGMAEIALEAHQIYTAEVRHPVEVTASEQDHLQAWLSKRVGHAFIIPDLSAEGYTLLGGRLLVGDGRPAGQLMYEDAS
jgi:anti-sigma factor RsiW